MQWAFASVSQFIVYSKVEKQIYSDYFAIPAERFQVTLWGVTPPLVEPDVPLEAGDYICAIGGNARDYPTLIRAMESLPEIPLVIVVRPENIAQMELPANVKPLVNLPFGQAMNILQHSRFMVIPLKGSKVPCGHVTLVAAMHLGKSFIITNSDGVSDYVIPEVNGITCQPFDSEALAIAIKQLWQDPHKCQEMGKNGQHFADQHCSETAAKQTLAAMLKSRHILPEP